MRKRLVLILVVVAMAFAFTACDPNGGSNKLIVPENMRGNWTEVNGTSTLTATRDNIVIEFTTSPTGAGLDMKSTISLAPDQYEISSGSDYLTIVIKGTAASYDFRLNGNQLDFKITVGTTSTMHFTK